MKQDPQAWYDKNERFFVNIGFKKSKFDHSIYVLHVEGNTLIVVVYVDEFILTRKKHDLIFRLKHWFFDAFEMTNLGPLHFFLGVQVLQLLDGLFIS